MWDILTLRCELTVKCSSGYVVLFQSVLNFHQLALEDFCGRVVAQAFARRCVEAVANRLQISICQRRRFGRAGQVFSQSVIRVFHRAFLIRRLRVTKPSISTDPVLEALPGRELGAAIKGDGLARIGGQGREPLDQRLHDRF